ncbi:MAG: nicotinamide mononucleotide transporter [Alphaproteobacteria bacterium]|nr:nicotinamide mononucleotide transporter [Alphaproteobacteria bacterium]
MIKTLLTLENAAALLGLVNVGLLVRRSIWNYAFGIGSVGLYGYVFFSARLYSDAILQIYFFGMQFYGWWNWYHGLNRDGLARIETLPTRMRLMLGGTTLGIALALGLAFRTYTNAAAPFLDASLAATSVTAQYLLSVRKLENWLLWIAADVAYIGLYYWKGLFSTAILYAVFLVLSLAGLLEWLHEYRSHDTAITAEVTT